VCQSRGGWENVRGWSEHCFGFPLDSSLGYEVYSDSNSLIVMGIKQIPMIGLGMPRIFSEAGFTGRFYMADLTEPIHIHVYEDGEDDSSCYS
jgi:hypothetical protein